MVEILIANSFVFGGTCSSCGGNMKFYNKQGFENKRIKLGNGGYWVQQKINNIHWTTIDYGSEKTLQEKINQWFN